MLHRVFIGRDKLQKIVDTLTPLNLQGLERTPSKPLGLEVGRVSTIFCNLNWLLITRKNISSFISWRGEGDGC